MKKLFCMLMAGCVAFSLAACGGGGSGAGADAPKAEESQEAGQEAGGEEAAQAQGQESGAQSGTSQEAAPGEESAQESMTGAEAAQEAVTGEESASDEDGQNPVMNFIGNYVCDRARALVECTGRDGAKVTIEWAGSARDLARWEMEGPLDTDTLEVEYSGCVKTVLSFDEEGRIIKEDVEYEDGTGTITFTADGGFVWHDGKGENDDMAFEWLPVSNEDGISYTILVNKIHPLPEDWEDELETVHMTNSVGDDVEVEAKAYDAYLGLKAALEEEGIFVDLDSAYRSVAEQQRIMDDFTEKYGADYAAKTVATPGFSEHHTGLALDLYLIIDGRDVVENEDMIQYPEIWAKIHEKLPEYGFILRYLEGKEHITGYGYEPWHIRYIDDAGDAMTIRDQGITLEEYLGDVEASDVEIDYGTSGIYTREELEEAAIQVKCSFASFAGCELHSLHYAGDEANTEENLQWLNSLSDGAAYTQVAEFLTDFHTSPYAEGAWEPDEEYTDYQWWLGKNENGGWEVVSWGY